MNLTRPSVSEDSTRRKIDIAQVSLSLQDRLGLAKVKYQNGRLPPSASCQEEGLAFGSDRPSDSSSEISPSGYDTPLTSPITRGATLSKELPRSRRNRHAATFDMRVMQPMLSASRKRVRSDSGTERPAKVPRTSWKSTHRLPESSPAFSRYPRNRYSHHHVSFLSDNATIPEFSSPACRAHSDEENDPDLPAHKYRNTVSSMVSSSPPRTPPPKQPRFAQPERSLRTDDGADLLLFLANSPTPARVSVKGLNRDFPPSTPPSQHAALPSSLTPTPGGGFPYFGTPNQQFNFADFVNVTPSPAQPAWGSWTPGHHPSRTPLTVRESRKKLNFDSLVPHGADTPKPAAHGAGLALQLGGELRP